MIHKMNPILSFAIGLFIGAVVGVFVTALNAVASRDDELRRRYEEKENTIDSTATETVHISEE